MNDDMGSPSSFSNLTLISQLSRLLSSEYSHERGGAAPLSSVGSRGSAQVDVQ